MITNFKDIFNYYESYSNQDYLMNKLTDRLLRQVSNIFTKGLRNKVQNYQGSGTIDLDNSLKSLCDIVCEYTDMQRTKNWAWYFLIEDYQTAFQRFLLRPFNKFMDAVSKIAIEFLDGQVVQDLNEAFADNNFGYRIRNNENLPWVCINPKIIKSKEVLEVIRLEYLTGEDFQKILDWNKNTTAEFLLQWAGPTFEHPLTQEQLETFYSKGINKADADTFVYKIIENENNHCIGLIELGQIDKINRSGRIRRFLIGDREFRGKGIGLAVLQKIINIGLNQFHLHRLALGVFTFNRQAVRCYEKAGFVQEGLLRDLIKVDSSYWSLYEMSILEDEWQVNF